MSDKPITSHIVDDRGASGVTIVRIETPSDWSPSEAIYAFAAYLTTRPTTFPVGGSAVVGDMMTHLIDFCLSHELALPRPGWEHAKIPQVLRIDEETPNAGR
jgi:hypothetical protein